MTFQMSESVLSKKNKPDAGAGIDTSQWISIEECAARAGLSTRQLARVFKRHKFTVTKTQDTGGPNPRILYGADAFDEWLEENRTDLAKEETQESIATIMHVAAGASKQVNEAGTIAITAAAKAVVDMAAQMQDVMKTMSLRSEAIAEGLRDELKDQRNHARRLEGKQFHLWELLTAMHEAQGAEIIKAARDKADGIAGQSRAQFISESFKMAWPGMVHRLFPSSESEQGIIAIAYKAMSDEMRMQLFGLLAKLPDEVRSSVAALFEGAMHKLAAEQGEEK